MNQKLERIYVYIVKYGLFLIPFIPLVITSSMLFPFITGKNFLFRILVGVLLIFWTPLAILKKEWRPRPTTIFILVSAVFFAVVLATIFSAQPYKSFWSNYERMEGLMTHLHLFLYFLMLSSVLKTKKDWHIFLHSTLFASIILGLYGLGQKLGFLRIFQGVGRVEATIGNAAYFAAYLLFHVFVSLYFLFSTTARWRRIAYGALFLFLSLMLYFTATRGALMAYFGGMFLLLLFILIRGKEINVFVSRLRPVAIAALFVAILLPILFFGFLQKTDFVQKSPVLARFTGESFLNRNTISRFTIWKISFQGFLERPIFGWGPENFPLVFQKYYNPELVEQEPWFDRSHNIIFDWLNSTGIVGFLLYVSLFIASIVLLIKQWRKETVVAIVFIPAIIAYFGQNFFVFDNLNTYILFFAVLGFINFTVSSHEKEQVRLVPSAQSSLAAISVFMAILFVIFGYSLHYKPIQQSRYLITSLKTIRQAGDLPQGLKYFRKALSYDSFGNGETREQLGSLAINVSRSPTVSDDVKRKYLDMALDEMNRQKDRFPQEARYWIFLSSLYNARGQTLIIGSDFDEAERVGLEARKLSPKKQQIHYELSQTYLNKGQVERAFEVAKEARDLYPRGRMSQINLGLIAILAGKTSEEAEVFEALKGTLMVEDLLRFINVYIRVGKFDRAATLYERVVQLEPSNIQYRVSLASVYVQFGQKQKAIVVLEEAKKLNPQEEPQLNKFIQQVKNL